MRLTMKISVGLLLGLVSCAFAAEPGTATNGGPTDLGQCQGAQMYDCSGSTGTPQNPGYSGQVGSACVNLCLAPDGVTCGTCYEPLAVCKALYPRFTWGWVATWHENFPDGVKCPTASPQQANATYVLPDGTCPPNEGEGNIGCGNKGNHNIGIGNYGDGNVGHYNTGSYNVGQCNRGNGNQGANLEGMFLEGQGGLECNTKLPTTAGGRGYTSAQQIGGSLPVTGSMTLAPATSIAAGSTAGVATMGRRLS